MNDREFLRGNEFPNPRSDGRSPSRRDFLATLSAVGAGIVLAPGVSHPQMGLDIFCCSTMWLPMMAGSFSSARRDVAASSNSIVRMKV